MMRLAAVRGALRKPSAQIPELAIRTLATKAPSPAFTSLPSLSSASKISPVTKIYSGTSSTPKVSSPSIGFFNQLKKEEHRFSRKRVRFEYEDNYTSALASPYSTDKLSREHEDVSSLLAMSEKYIVEHANRRVDLFFYTLVAYYRTNVMPIEGHTTLQHGRGRTLDDETNLTQACHSSFIPSLIDPTIDKKKRRKSLLSGTHFLESLNSTVELPPFVNAFDDLLESICRPKCMAILQKVSVGELDPVQGLSSFLTIMDTLLEDFKRQAAAKKYSGLSHSVFSGPSAYVNPKLIDLVIKGTLGTTFMADSSSVNEEYVQLLLRMTKEEQSACRGSATKRGKIYSEKFIELQEEILKTKSSESSFTI